MQEPPHRNHGLFSDYYLANILPRHPEWGRLVAEAAPRMARVYALFDLTPDEIRIVEESTKYRYGEV